MASSVTPVTGAASLSRELRRGPWYSEEEFAREVTSFYTNGYGGRGHRGWSHRVDRVWQQFEDCYGIDDACHVGGGGRIEFEYRFGTDRLADQDRSGWGV